MKSFFIYSAIIIATILGAEALARIYSWSPNIYQTHSGDDLGSLRYHHSTTGYGDLVPNQDGHWLIWHKRPYHVVTNSVGLRNTEEPREGVKRILAIGDSQTFGPYLANEDTWPVQLENKLRQNGSKVQVFNAAISGYTILDQYNYLVEKGVAFKPDTVILAVYENDVLDLRKESGGRVMRPLTKDIITEGQRSIRRYLRLTALSKLIENWKHQAALQQAGVDTRTGENITAAPSAPDPDEETLKNRYAEIFKKTVTLLRENNITLQVIFIPAADALEGRSSQVEPLIRSLTQETGTPYTDMTPTLTHASADPVAAFYLLQRDPMTRAWVGNAHLSREGNGVIGRSISF